MTRLFSVVLYLPLLFSLSQQFEFNIQNPFKAKSMPAVASSGVVPLNKAGLEKEDHVRDAAYHRALHGKTAKSVGGIAAMIGKDNAAQRLSSENYFKFFKGGAGETEEEAAERKANYASLTKEYYNLATDLYEYGWGQSFHFCRYYDGEGFNQGLARHEHYLAAKMGLKAGDLVLDVGCGVGGPAREIARFADVNIVGFNNNDYQIARATQYAANANMSNQLTFRKGDFMQMPAEFEGMFDAVYAIEATVHASSLEGVYSQIFKALKPGGVFGVYEWLMTEKFDESNPEHVEIRHNIEIGDGIAHMCTIETALTAMKAAGFQLEWNEDLADRPDSIPWYYGLAGEWKYIRSVGDFFRVARMSPGIRDVLHGMLGVGEVVRIIPPGTKKTADMLAQGAVGLVAGGRSKLFTPMYLMVGRKPL